MFVIYDGRESFYQWDKEQKLIVKDETITDVHFCNKTDDCALVCEVYTYNGLRVVDVPNILLQTDWKIRVYGYCANHTKVEKCFKVNSRNKPSDYVYWETDVKDYNNLYNRVEDIESDISECLFKTSICMDRTDGLGLWCENLENDIIELEGKVPNQEIVKDGVRETNEYFNGKRVYSVYFNGGAFPSKSSKKITIQALKNANADAIVSIVGCARNGSGRAQSIPFHSAAGNYADIFAYATGDVQLVSNYEANNSLCSSEFEIRFTKK